MDEKEPQHKEEGGETNFLVLFLLPFSLLWYVWDEIIMKKPAGITNDYKKDE